MRSVFLLFFPFVFVAAEPTATGPVDAVSDEAWVMLSINSLSGTRDALEGHPFFEGFADEELYELLMPQDGGGGVDGKPSPLEVMEEEFHLTTDEFFDLFPGEAHFVLYGMGTEGGSFGNRPDFLILAQFSGDDERLKELMDIQFERNAASRQEVNPAMEHHMIEETFMGETLYFSEAFNGEETYIEYGYAFVDGAYILATTDARLRSVVEAVKEGSDAPLSRVPGFLRMVESGDSADVSIYVNFPAIVPVVNEALRKVAQVPWMAGLGVTPDSLVDALALDVLEAFFLDFSLREDGALMRSGLTYREKRGLTALLTYGRGELPAGGFVPEEPVSTSVTLFDSSAFYEACVRLLFSASPSIGQMFEMQMQIMEGNLDIPLRDSLLANLGEEMVGFAVFDASSPGDLANPQPRQVIAVSVRDPESFNFALDGLLGQNPGLQADFQKKDFEGYTITTVPGQPDPGNPGSRLDDVSYAVSRDHVFLSIGRESVLMECLGRLDEAEGGFWQRPEVDEWFDPISRPGAVSRSYTDLEGMVDSILVSLGQAFGGMPVPGEERGMAALAELGAKLEMPFILLAEMNEEEDGLYSRALMRTKTREDER